MIEIRTVQVTRYVTPLKEGGSLPAIAEADDDFTYVVKFRGAGQGIKALVAELIGGELARVLGLKVPEIVFAQLDSSFGRTEPDEEIQDLLKASIGENLALHYLAGAITYDPSVNKVDPIMASKIVWLDALITNMDRTARNANMLIWHRELWLIDHGAALYFHHNWTGHETASKSTFPMIKDHILLAQATELEKTDATCKALISEEKLKEIINLIPDSWLQDYDPDYTPEMVKKTYFDFIWYRIQHSEIFLNTAIDARAALI
ncbi:hypothetical protein SAMN05192529_10222 [Arachidicoccus rhizosphaerae]|uniref:HipA-like kinase domain-containing protein n=1 Tax=Arachidicoccus rhizosphaerae TaxID=551991 RepID=A0A1H3W062_9BACT|nr:HipA family kinase [Arachidicoccus rhizosphaerae]SDZ80463.1 hypothetical protein SAMN05192529_10222 [Arachidicoccus rhizosphaerae]